MALSSTRQTSSNWSGSMLKSRNQRANALAAIGATPTKIWKSRISWRIAMSAFLTILVVQIAITFATFKQEEFTLLDGVRELGRSVIAPNIGTPTELLASPVSQEQADRIVTSTIVKGFTVYSLDLRILGSYGEPVSLVLSDQDSLGRTYRSMDGSSYEVVYRSNDLRRPYIVATRLDSQNVAPALLTFVKKTLMIMLLMSAFVTVVLMISLSKWLLEPILFMRDNLLAAAENPENPDIKESPFDPQDEVGGAILLTQKLIQQNAENITQIKSAAEDKIHKLAYYDSLTGLPNRTLFLQKLTEQARKANDEDGNHPKRFAVIALDLDHFKDINDSMGHNIGDAILRGVGKRLRAALPESAVVARSGEDEFAITMPLTSDAMTSRDVADKILKVIRTEPFKVFNESFQIRSSVGVSTFPDDAIDPDQVLKKRGYCAEPFQGRRPRYSQGIFRRFRPRRTGQIPVAARSTRCDGCQGSSSILPAAIRTRQRQNYRCRSFAALVQKRQLKGRRAIYLPCRIRADRGTIRFDCSHRRMGHASFLRNRRSMGACWP